jgi:hypothetical protein
MTTIAKFFSREDSFVARSFATVREQAKRAVVLHLEICQVYAEALARNNKR